MKQIKLCLILTSLLFVSSFAQVFAQKENNPIQALRDYEVTLIATNNPDDKMKNVFFWEDGKYLQKVGYAQTELTSQFIKKAEALTSYNIAGKEKYLLVNFVYMPENQTAKIFAPKLDQTYFVRIDKLDGFSQIRLFTISKFGEKKEFKRINTKLIPSKDDQDLLKSMIALM